MASEDKLRDAWWGRNRCGAEIELQSFVRILDRLTVPWMDMIGNHDVLAFGNLLPGVEMSSKALLMGPDFHVLEKWYGEITAWIVDATIKADLKLDVSQCAGCDDDLVADDIKNGNFERGFVEQHCGPQSGLLEPDADSCRGFELGPSNRGYYSFEELVPSDGDDQLGFSKILVVVLNTTDFGDYDRDPRMRGGEGGFIGLKQISWLDEKIGYSDNRNNAVNDKIVLVFGHHPLATIRSDGHGDELEKRLHFLAKQDRLIGYFTGHKHRHRITLHCEKEKQTKCERRTEDGAKCIPKSRFWEVETSSVIGFPQEARWVTLRSLGPGLGFIELVPFGHNVPMDESTPVRRALLRGAQGAERDACRKKGCVRPQRTDGEHAAARLFIRLPKKANVEQR
ncbi:MAG: metallophosphoesterase [Myxococcales bacterium]|nr:metallophosphoesterase [Myxococcales bacterium]